MNADSNANAETPPNFIRDLIQADVSAGKRGGKVATRFPPEPNGYLHIGHAKAICLNFGMAQEFEGSCNLRFDDTNPEKEDTEFVEAIQRDIAWLGLEWNGEPKFTSNYFEKLYELAQELIRAGLAYVDSQSAEEIRENRGNFHNVGKNSPFRERSVEENLELFAKMRAGGFEEGEAVLRAKIDMSHSNQNLRDPLMYRVRKVVHHRTGNEWVIYPMYDWAHGLSDAIEGISHSCCSLEFENHRPLYDWFLEALNWENAPQQIEFARLALTYTVLSKRKLQELVVAGHVDGWDDPRMPTLAGMRRRGFSAQALRNFCDRIGVSRRNGVVDVGMLEYAQREYLNEHTPRTMGVINPLKVVLENYPEGEEEFFDAVNHPTDESFGSRKLPFGREIYIEREDFMLDPPKKFFRLAPGREIRLRYACIIKCVGYTQDEETGEITEVRCTFDPDSRGGQPADGRKVRGTSHWVSAKHAVDAEVRLYDRLFSTENPTGDKEGRDFKEFLNETSMTLLPNAKLEPSLGELETGKVVQFERLGYFCKDARYSTESKLVFNRTISLKDSWAKAKKGGGKPRPQKQAKQKKKS